MLVLQHFFRVFQNIRSSALLSCLSEHPFFSTFFHHVSVVHCRNCLCAFSSPPQSDTILVVPPPTYHPRSPHRPPRSLAARLAAPAFLPWACHRERDFPWDGVGAEDGTGRRDRPGTAPGRNDGSAPEGRCRGGAVLILCSSAVALEVGGRTAHPVVSTSFVLALWPASLSPC
jgi:hypothetical protein